MGFGASFVRAMAMRIGSRVADVAMDKAIEQVPKLKEKFPDQTKWIPDMEQVGDQAGGIFDNLMGNSGMSFSQIQGMMNGEFDMSSMLEGADLEGMEGVDIQGLMNDISKNGSENVDISKYMEGVQF